jgi:tetratricopeptide (TPR) repeat protein
LQQNKLLPIEMLLNVEQSSPYYNEANQASVFYAESWALVHYLMMDPEAQQRQLLKNFLVTWEKGGNQIEAAQQTFGDLKRFGQIIEGYSRQQTFRMGLMKNGQQAADKSYTVRSLPVGEVLALRGDSATHRNRLEQAKPLVEQSIQAEPNLPLSHEALGYYLHRKGDHSGADKEMRKAIELGSATFVAPYYHGMLLMEGGLTGPEVVHEAVASLQKATQMNPQFAPAFEGLAQAYSFAPETQKQAVDAGIHAAKLDPTARAYAINVVYLLLNNNQDADAKQLAQRILEKAKSPAELQAARDLLERVKEHEQFVLQRNAPASVPEEVKVEAKTIVGSAAAEGQSMTVSSTPEVDPRTLMAVDGLVHEVDCSHRPAVTVSMIVGKSAVGFHAGDFRAVGVTGAAESVMSLESCEKWKGRKMRIWFRAVKGKQYLGEITNIAFD